MPFLDLPNSGIDYNRYNKPNDDAKPCMVVKIVIVVCSLVFMWFDSTASAFLNLIKDQAFHTMQALDSIIMALL